MKYVYILQSLADPERHYTGCTQDLKKRLVKHNAGEVSHTSKFAPWRLVTYVAFSDEIRAFAFERYLKSPSGRAFAKKRSEVSSLRSRSERRLRRRRGIHFHRCRRPATR